MTLTILPAPGAGGGGDHGGGGKGGCLVMSSGAPCMRAGSEAFALALAASLLLLALLRVPPVSR